MLDVNKILFGIRFEFTFLGPILHVCAKNYRLLHGNSGFFINGTGEIDGQIFNIFSSIELQDAIDGSFA